VAVSPSTLKLLILLRFEGVGPQAAIRFAAGDLSDHENQPQWSDARAAAQVTVDESSAAGVDIVGWFDRAFPQRLRKIPDPPAVLYARGKLDLTAAAHAVAVVGTREPNSDGRARTEEITTTFAQAGWTIVSGLALGVDTVAHEVALRHNAPTVAVLGSGLDAVYPARNRGLAHEIVESGGLLLAEVPPGVRVNARQLVARDRLQSGLSDLTIVCQAGIHSGAMHTARFAIEQRRPLYVPLIEDESALGEDAGIAALQHAAGRELPRLIPAWNHARPRDVSSSHPVAARLTEALLANLDWAKQIDEARSAEARPLQHED
jgi:DNA processing protein